MLVYGGHKEYLFNGRGGGVKTTMKNGTIVVYRIVTSTPDSPAVDISISAFDTSGIHSQKIHFIKKR